MLVNIFTISVLLLSVKSMVFGSHLLKLCTENSYDCLLIDYTVQENSHDCLLIDYTVPENSHDCLLIDCTVPENSHDCLLIDYTVPENSHDEELDAILGELSELETQFSREIGEDAAHRGNGGSKFRKVKNTHPWGPSPLQHNKSKLIASLTIGLSCHSAQ